MRHRALGRGSGCVSVSVRVCVCVCVCACACACAHTCCGSGPGGRHSLQRLHFSHLCKPTPVLLVHALMFYAAGHHDACQPCKTECCVRRSAPPAVQRMATRDSTKETVRALMLASMGAPGLAAVVRVG